MKRRRYLRRGSPVQQVIDRLLNYLFTFYYIPVNFEFITFCPAATRNGFKLDRGLALVIDRRSQAQ